MSAVTPSRELSYKLTKREILATCIALVVYLPITLIKSLVQHVTSKKRSKSLPVRLRDTARLCVAANVPVRVVQRLVDGPKLSDIKQSNRFSALSSQVMERVSHDGFGGYWVCRGMKDRPIEAKDADLVIYYIHGGGYVLGDPIVDAPNLLLVAEQLSKAGITPAIFALDYTLVPERVFPCQFDEAAEGYRWLIGNMGIPASKILILGESAGGHLALSLLIHLRSMRSRSSVEDVTTPKPACMFLMSPWCDLYNSNPRAVNADLEESLFKQALTTWANLALQDLDQSQKALYQDYASRNVQRGIWKDILPEIVWVSAGSSETIFKHDIVSFVEQARQDGVTVSYEVKEGGEHAWQTVRARVQHPEFLSSAASLDRTDLMEGYQRLAASIVSGCHRAAAMSN